MARATSDDGMLCAEWCGENGRQTQDATKPRQRTQDRQRRPTQGRRSEPMCWPPIWADIGPHWPICWPKLANMGRSHRGPIIGQHCPISAHVGPYRPTLWLWGMTRGQLACQLAPLLPSQTFYAAALPEKRLTRQQSSSTGHDQVGSSRQRASAHDADRARPRRNLKQAGVSTPPPASQCWNRVKHCLHEGALVMLNMVVECQPYEVMRTGEKKMEYRQNKAYWRKRLLTSAGYFKPFTHMHVAEGLYKTSTNVGRSNRGPIHRPTWADIGSRWPISANTVAVRHDKRATCVPIGAIADSTDISCCGRAREKTHTPALRKHQTRPGGVVASGGVVCTTRRTPTSDAYTTRCVHPSYGLKVLEPCQTLSARGGIGDAQYGGGVSTL